MLQVLAERSYHVDELVLLASERSAGERISFAGREYTVQAVAAEHFEGCDIALFSAGATRSREWAPIAAAAGAVVIDNSSAFRMDPDVPLVVPEVNAAAMARRPKGIIANPNCATIQLVVALEALHRAGTLRRVAATTFQSVSGAGHKGIAALRAELDGSTSHETPFVSRIAGNVIPFIGPRGDDGWNEEEVKVREETRKILGLPDLAVTATCVRVPVEVGHSVSAIVQLEHALSAGDAIAALRTMPEMNVFEGATDPLPRDVAGTDAVNTGRVRVDPDDPHTLHIWVVADNLRKGAATNAVQIAQALGANTRPMHVLA
jgi:aspartate-semialdehyde dehydrogenase